ncbi:hypothetical protein WR25_13278 [Diploscapter pachys]|uniref:Uncharacterized protein n=1 Tax=Diploscapter pachys TaxID=2018661 RepID=A0A2A2M5L7_9BILA|nr:hypothetical protein WR25_13278 [Diploscapter pachys]
MLMQELEKAKSKILKIPPMNGSEEKDAWKIFSLTKLSRWKLYNFWRMKLQSLLREKMPNLIDSYKKSCDTVRKYNIDQDAGVCRKALVSKYTKS